MSRVPPPVEITPQRLHWLADDAVRRERSAGPNSLRTGNLTGNFSILGLFLRFSLLIDAEIQWLAAKFPTHRNREFFRPEQGIWQRDQGISGREQGMSRDVFRTSFSVTDKAGREALLLLGPARGQRARECREGEIGRRGAVEEGRHDPRRDKGERSEKPHVPFDLAFATGDRGEAGGAAVGQIVDPLARLGDRDQEGVAPRRLHGRVVSRHIDDALEGGRDWARPRDGDRRDGGAEMP